MTQIKTSITAGIRPTSMIFHEQPTDPWTPFDFKLLEAYQILQDELCPKCGHPIWLCRSSSNRVEFKAQAAYCAGERALKEKEDQSKPVKERAQKSERSRWGEFFYTTPYSPPNVEGGLPSRTEFYREVAGKST